jgi:hypothetical protein
MLPRQPQDHWSKRDVRLEELESKASRKAIGGLAPADGLRESPAQAMGVHLVHSGPVVTHRLASCTQPAGQQVCANAGDISAYAKTRINSLRYRMPFPSFSLTARRQILILWGGKRARQSRFRNPFAQHFEPPRVEECSKVRPLWCPSFTFHLSER